MANHTAAVVLAAAFLGLQCMPSPAFAENQMGYQLLSAQQAAHLPHSGGAVGMDIGQAQQITDGSMTFELLQVKQVRPNSPGAQAGFKAGDQIIAVDGRVFPSVAAFAACIGSVQPGRQIAVDTMPANGGPQQAQRVGVTVGANGRAMPARGDDQQRTGMSTGSKLAIGAGAAALFGCYEIGCFSHPQAKQSDAGPQQPAAGLQQQR